MDDISKRFIVSGQGQLREFENNIGLLEQDLISSCQSLLPAVNIPVNNPDAAKSITERAIKEINKRLSERYNVANKLRKDMTAFQKRMQAQHQPSYKLHQAIVHAVIQDASLDKVMANMTLDSSAAAAKRGSDESIRNGCILLEMKAICLVLEDKWELADMVQGRFATNVSAIKFSGGPKEHPIALSPAYLDKCRTLVKTGEEQSLPKIGVEAALYYSRIARLLSSSSLIREENRDVAKNYRETAKALLQKATVLCQQPFQGANVLAQAVDHSEKLLGKEFYEAVTKEEIEAIKMAMVSGPRGIATHAGHWYKCAKGHPVSSCTRQFLKSTC